MRARLEPIAGAVSEVWRWWLDEMSTLMPARWRERRAGSAIVRFTDEAVHIDRIADGQGERFTDPRHWSELDEQDWAQCGELIGGVKPIVILDHPMCYHAPLTLPKAARRALGRAVELQLSEISPLKPEFIIWKPHGLRESDGQLQLRVAMVKRDTVDELGRIFAKLDRAAPEIHAGDGDTSIRMVSSGGDRRHNLELLKSIALAVLLILSIPLTIAVGASALTSRNQAEVDELRDRAAPLLVAERAEALMERRRVAIARIAKIPTASGPIVDLARLLPPGSRIESIGRDGSDMLSLVIATPDAALAREAVEAAPALGLQQTSEEPSDDGLTRATFRLRP